MAIFTEHKVQLAELLKIIPEELFSRIAPDTQVDYYTKVLYGKVIFYLLLYALLSDERLDQRGIAGLYSSPHFRALFNLELGKTRISHSSVSERLSKIETEYFEQLYEIIHNRYSALYPSETLCGLTLQRVDSSPVSEVSNKLKEGLTWGNENKKGKMLKYTINCDGMYGSLAKVHKEDKYASGSNALPENVPEHFKKSKNHSSVYIFDRGQNSTKSFGEMRFDLTFKRFGYGVLKQDAIVQLYGYKHTTGKNGKDVKTPYPATEKYRVIRFRPAGKKEDILLITHVTQPYHIIVIKISIAL